MKKKPKEEQLELFAFVGDTMIIQDQIDLFKPEPPAIDLFENDNQDNKEDVSK